MKKLLLLLILLFPLESWAAVPTPNLPPEFNFGDEVFSLSFNITVPSPCANNAVVVGIGRHATIGTDVTGVTVGGDAAEFVGAGSVTEPFWAESWIRKNVTTGTPLTVDITLSDLSLHITGIAVSFCGVDQTTPFANATGADTSSSGQTALIIVPVTSTSNDLVVDFAYTGTNDPATVVTVGSGQTPIIANIVNGLQTMATSYQAGAGVVTMSWDLDQVDFWSQSAFSLKGVSGAAPVAARRRVVEQ